MKHLKSLGVCGPVFAGALVLSSHGHAATFAVTNTGDAGPGSLRAAITSANAQAGDDVIDLSGLSGKIELESALPTLSSNISLVGPGKDKLTIQRKLTANIPRFRLLLVNNGIKEKPTVKISGLKFYGGAPLENDFQGKGGAIYASDCTLQIERCEFFRNLANTGAGLQIENSSVHISQSTFDSNRAKFFGGAIFHAGGDFILVTSTLSRNDTGNSGGGLYSTGAGATSLRVLACTVSGNSAANGGGLYLRSNWTLVVNSTLTLNRTSQAGTGGGIWFEPVDKGKHQIGSSIIAGNTQGDDVRALKGPGEFVSLGCNLIGSGANPAMWNGSGDQLSVLDAKLGPLQPNGGPTLTHLPALDSPAIDKGREYLLLSQTDQRGQKRTHNFPAISDAPPQNPPVVWVVDAKGTDVGAVEVQPALPNLRGLPVFKLPNDLKLPPNFVPPLMRDGGRSEETGKP